MTRLLIVDDSALMRRQLSTLFANEGGFEIEQAHNGKEAVELNKTFLPDVVLLDINMPEMDGMTALSMMMVERPVPVVMLSSLTEKGALVTFEALALGAVDYIAKPGGTISLSIDVIKREIVNKVKTAKRAKLRLSKERRQSKITVDKSAKPLFELEGVGVELVLIGVSTGGPKTLEDVLPKLPANFPVPVVVAQHMPAGFTKSFADRMDQLCSMHVSELTRLEPLKAGHIYICKGGADTIISGKSGALKGMVKPESAQYLWHPSVELLGQSALKVLDAKKIIGVILTGMGSDGSKSFAEIKRLGGRTIAESEESSVVFGMPCELVKAGGATAVLPATAVAKKVTDWVKK